jgi:proteic killer suppression protein
MIRSFGNELTLQVFEGRTIDGFPVETLQRALVKLQMIHAATELRDLESVASNKLELLGGQRHGKHCICVDEHARVCFRWDRGHAYDVELFGYH